MRAATLTALLRHAWRRHRVALLAITAAVSLFQFILTRIAPSPNEVNWMTMILTSMPQEMRTLIGNEVGLSTGGFLAIGYVHPFFMLLVSVWVVRASSAAIAGEIGRGTIDLLASRPVARWEFVAAGFISMAIGLMVILVASFAATAAGLRVRQLEVHAASFAGIPLTAALLFAAWGSVGLGISAMRRDASQAIAWTTAVIAVSFVLDYLARLWSTIARLRSLSLFRYYEPQAILAGGVSRQTILVLVSTIVAGLVAAVVAIQRRDL